MKISLNWLKTLIPLQQTPEEIEAILTATGLEVEHFEAIDSVKGGMRGLLSGLVTECVRHPNADKLSLCKVETGSGEPLSIVCGAPNVAEGLKVIVAPVGTTIFPLKGDPFTIQKSKIRGEYSEGMLCAEDEIGLGESHDGLLILPPETPVGQSISELFKVESDVMFEIGLTANRGDAASHLGVARELATVLELPFSLHETIIIPESTSKHIDINVEDAEACPRYCGLMVEGLEVKESPEWLKQRLNTIGLRAINNVVDITNYVLHELGQPLHAFDLDKINGGQILVRRAKVGEKFTTLDAVERTLNGNELMVCDSDSAMCMAGIYGGISSGVTAGTQRIFLESAYFAPDVIRKAAKQHGLSTDSSFRFERGTDPDMCIPALKKAAALLCEYAGGKVVSEIYDQYPQPLLPFQVTLRTSMVRKITGIDIPKNKIEQILHGLGIDILSETDGNYTLEVPRFKGDVTREIDVIEELIRIYGFSHIPLQQNLRMSLNYKPGNTLRLAERRISGILSACGFMEIMNNSLSSDKYYSDKSELVYMSNPLSAEMNVLRASMVYTALEALAYNKNRKQQNTRFFEFGKVYKQKEKGFKEQEQLLIMASGMRSNESWEEKPAPVDHFYIKSMAQKVLDAFDAGQNEIIIEEVDSATLQQFGIKDQVFYTLIDWTKLAKQKKTFSLKAIPQFPVVRRDLSLVLDKNVQYGQVLEIIRKKGGKKVCGSNVFDLYEGKPLEDGQKAMSISIELYDEEKTMSDADIDPLMHTLISAFESELNAIIRK